MATTAEPRTFATIDEALEDFRAGKFVVVVDAPDRENEGDLTIAAEFATPDAINFMAMHGRGVICLCLTEQRCDELQLRTLASSRESRLGTAYTTTIDAREGITTGVSAADRAYTISVAIDPASRPHDLIEGGCAFAVLRSLLGRKLGELHLELEVDSRKPVDDGDQRLRRQRLELGG